MTDIQNVVLDHWKNMARKRRGIPAREDFRIQDLGKHVTNIVVLDIECNPTDFTYRLIGSDIAENLSEDYTGKSLSDLPGKGPDSRIWSNMKAVRDAKKPVLLDVPYVGPKPKHKKLSTLYLPLASDYKTPDKILVVPNFPTKRKMGLFSPRTDAKDDKEPQHWHQQSV